MTDVIRHVSPQTSTSQPPKGATPQWKRNTPLTISKGELFEKLKNRADLPVPRSLDPAGKEGRTQSGKYYKFHNDCGHLTDHCREFSSFVEQLISKGELGNFVKKSRGRDNCKSDPKGKRPHSPSPDSDNNENRQRKTINMIFGGESVGQNRGYSRKVLMSKSTPRDNGKWVREEKSIYFFEEDLDDVLQPHEDPLVIQADIGPNSRVERMIVDSGSSADILYMDTFTKMGLKREELSPCKEAIYGFTNIAAPVAGVIDLKVSIGSKRGRVSRTCRFIVVEVESTFHGIFGRPLMKHGICYQWARGVAR